MFFDKHHEREEAMMESLLDSTIQVCACVFAIFDE